MVKEKTCECGSKINECFEFGPPDEPPRQRLPDERKSITHKFTIVGGGISGNDLDCYLTVGFYLDGSVGELFFRAGKEGGNYGVYDSFMTAISVGLQYGIPLKVFTDKFRFQQFSPKGITNSKYVPIAKSIVDYIARYLEIRFGVNKDDCIKESDQEDTAEG